MDMETNIAMRPAPGPLEVGSIQGPRSSPFVALGDRSRYSAYEGLS